MPSARKTKAPKSSKKSAKQAAVVEEVVAPVEAAPVEVAPVEAAPLVTGLECDTGLSSDFSELLTQLSTMRTQLTALSTRVRTLQKGYERERKQAVKAMKRRSKKTGNRAPSGFVKPTEISKELASFLGKPVGTEMARTAVTREINQYIREHKLQDPANGRRILPDAKLRKLLRVPQTDELTYFNLQRYMSPHFHKNTPATAATVSA